MARPKEYDEGTRVALREAAERLLATQGPAGMTVRAVAEAAGTTTQAVYSLYGSKDELLAAVAVAAYEQLAEGLDALPVTADPVADLVEVGATVFRGLIVEHPWRYRIAFQRVAPEVVGGAAVARARSHAVALLEARVRRARDAGRLGRATVREVVIAFNAMCEGMANSELRGATLAILPRGKERAAWRAAFRSLLRGFAD